VKVWRDTFEDAVEFWWAIDRAARKCIRTGEETFCGGKDGKLIRFDRSGPFMRMWLPSGRALHYCRPRIEERRTPWGEMRATITYEGLNDKNQWGRIGTHPGKLTENADQAIARDLLAHGIVLAHRRGLDLRLHVHDQIVAQVPEKGADRHLAVLQECMRTPPKWGRDCPLDSAGFVSKFFIKD
jgi:DNA polymerase